MHKKEYTVELAGKTLTAEFSDLADQANGSVIVRHGNTVVMATAVMSKSKREGMDFFPLMVEYEERFYAAGQILGSRFMRREGRPSDEAVLSGRIVDRTIRPLFDQRMRNEVQIVITVLSIDQDDPDVLAVIASSLALGTSDIPWNGPVSAVRIGGQKGTDLIVNPTYEFRRDANFEIDLLACGKDGKINMIEVGSDETKEGVLMEGLTLASSEIEKIQKFQQDIISEIGKEKIKVEIDEVPEETKSLFAEKITPTMSAKIMSGVAGKEAIALVQGEWKDAFKETYPEGNVGLAMAYFDEKLDELIHEEAINNNKRPDGRTMDEIRPLFAKAGGISPIHHGAGIFYRGGTHVLSVLTLGGPNDAQLVEGMEDQGNKRYMHHYNFPPFSVGETGRVGGFNRRMIGHGALAEKALIPVLPEKENFPYTIRIVSESMASNGSTSMGSVCGSTLSLMDAGVPIKRPVAGIASGLMMKSDTEYKVLTDIQGPEDHHGDMDFKVAGTTEGVTAVQMDVKVLGVTLKVLEEAFEKAKQARLQILKIMTDEIAVPRADISPNAPKIVAIKIKPTQIGMVIGSGGKTINAIREKTGAEIDIEEDGTVFVTGKDGSAEKAAQIIADMTREFVKGDRVDDAEVVKITDFGAFVKLNEYNEGLVHISELANFRVDKVENYLKVGDKVPVVVKDIDDQERIKLSLKDADPNFLKQKK